MKKVVLNILRLAMLAGFVYFFLELGSECATKVTPYLTANLRTAASQFLMVYRSGFFLFSCFAAGLLIEAKYRRMTGRSTRLIDSLKTLAGLGLVIGVLPMFYLTTAKMAAGAADTFILQPSYAAVFFAALGLIPIALAALGTFSCILELSLAIRRRRFIAAQKAV